MEILGFVLSAVLAFSGEASPATDPMPIAASVQQPEEVDAAEVMRHGNMMQKIDGRWRDDGSDAAVEAMGPPADEGDRWFISVIGMKGCGACNHLASDWKTDPYLLSLANPEDNSTSWANYNHYDRDDASQNRRWAGLRIGGYPTIVVQPPRSGKYGPASTVVLQLEGYDGNGKKLALTITNGIKRYVAKLASKANGGGVHSQEFDESLIGVNPPFIPPPKEPLSPTVPGVTFPTTIVPPEDAVKPAPANDVVKDLLMGIVRAIVGSVMALALIVAVVFGGLKYSIYRSRKAAEAADAEERNQTMRMTAIVKSVLDAVEKKNSSDPTVAK